MKIKFIAPDLAAFTGMYGAIEFKDGVSLTHVADHEVRLYGAITSIEVIGDDFTPEKSYDEVKHLAAVSTTLPTLAEIRNRAALAVAAIMAPPAGQMPETAAPSVIYTKEQLEAIADKQGIAGVRGISDALNVRGTSISKLIAGILAAQAQGKPAAEFIESPAQAVSVTITDALVEDKAE